MTQPRCLSWARTFSIKGHISYRSTRKLLKSKLEFFSKSAKINALQIGTRLLSANKAWVFINWALMF
jgi:hypothetical protein